MKQPKQHTVQVEVIPALYNKEGVEVIAPTYQADMVTCSAGRAMLRASQLAQQGKVTKVLTWTEQLS